MVLQFLILIFLTYDYFSFIYSNIPAAPVYGVYIPQLIRYSRACGVYHDFLVRGKPMNQVYTEYLCHIYVRFVVNAIDTFSHSSLVTGFATRLTTRVPLVEQELLTLSEHMSLSRVLSGVRVT